MAQNITLLGASYSNVPAVELPKTGGGTASFTDVTDTTAAASDVASGKYFFTANGVLTLGTNQGGSGDGYVWQDGSGYVHLSDEEGTQPIYDTLNVSSSGTFTPTTGHAYNSVVVPSGTEGTPTATKGTVSSHSIAITPSVTNTAGYISGGTKTGTAVSVSASELVSGNLPITQNGNNIDCANYSTVSVNVSGGSPTLITKNITANGTYNASSDNADGYSSVTVNVSGGGGLEYEEGTWVPLSDTARGTITFSNNHTKAPSIVVLADATGTNVSDLAQLNVLYVGVNFTDLFGTGFPYSATTTKDYYVSYAYRTTTGASSPSYAGYANISNTSGDTEQYIGYWATSTEFYPYSRSDSRKWASGRTYKWVAVWK